MHKRSRLWPVCCQQTCQDGDLLLEGPTLKVTLPFNHLALWFLFFLIRYVVLEHKHLTCHRLLVLFVFKNRTYRTYARPILQSTIGKGLNRVGVFLGPFFSKKVLFFHKNIPFLANIECCRKFLEYALTCEKKEKHIMINVIECLCLLRISCALQKKAINKPKRKKLFCFCCREKTATVTTKNKWIRKDITLTFFYFPWQKNTSAKIIKFSWNWNCKMDNGKVLLSLVESTLALKVANAYCCC